MFLPFKQPMVHLTYQTAFIDESGTLKVDENVYGLDARIRQILSSGGSPIVPPPAEQKGDLETLRGITKPPCARS
jgi:L,D-transpeptidase YcbB